MLLRQGAVSLEELRAVVPETTAYKSLEGETPRSPGIGHRHYTPKAAVVIVDSIISDALHSGSAYIGLDHDTVTRQFSHLKVCGSVSEYAHSLFEFFRECDRKGIHTIFCEEVQPTGIGAALMDRLRRAAAK